MPLKRIPYLHDRNDRATKEKAPSRSSTPLSRQTEWSYLPVVVAAGAPVVPVVPVVASSAGLLQPAIKAPRTVTTIISAKIFFIPYTS